MLRHVMAAGAALAISAPIAQAAPFDGSIVIEGGGTPVVFDIGGGEYLGLIGLVDAEVGDTVDLATIEGFVTSGTVTGLYGGSSGDNFLSDFEEFDLLAGLEEVESVDRAGDGRIFNSFYVSFDANSNLVFAGSATLGNTVTQDGNPLAPIPVPAAFPLLALALGGLGLASRRRRAA